MLAGRDAGFVDFFAVSRASVTCLLGLEQGVDVFFFGDKGVFDVLAGREAGFLLISSQFQGRL